MLIFHQTLNVFSPIYGMMFVFYIGLPLMEFDDVILGN